MKGRTYSNRIPDLALWAFHLATSSVAAAFEADGLTALAENVPRSISSHWRYPPGSKYIPFDQLHNIFTSHLITLIIIIIIPLQPLNKQNETKKKPPPPKNQTTYSTSSPNSPTTPPPHSPSPQSQTPSDARHHTARPTPPAPFPRTHPRAAMTRLPAAIPEPANAGPRCRSRR